MNGANSLKHKGKSLLRMSHKVGIHNWDKWEDMFAATLRSEFGIEPAAPVKNAVSTTPKRASIPQASATQQEYSRSALHRLKHEHGFEIDDKTSVGGNLWILTDTSNEHVNAVLTLWGFRNKPGKGWWK